MRISRPVIYLILGAAILVVSASILSYNLGRTSTISEVVTTTSVSTVSTTKTVTTTSLTPSSTTTTTSTSTTTAIIAGNATATTTTVTITSTANTTITSKISNTTSITKTSTITKTTTYTTTTTLSTTIPSASTFRFVVMGDSRGSNSNTPVNTDILSKLTNTANRFNPAFTLFTGDLCVDFNQDNCPTVWKNTVNSNLLTKTVPIRGNHDGGRDNAYWQSTFNISSIITSFGGTRYSYRQGQDSIDFSFDYGNSHFVGLAVIDDVSSSRPSSAQLSWLDADLTAAETTGCGGTGCALTFIQWHAPVYCISLEGGHCSPPPVPPAQWTTITNSHPSIVAIFHGHEHVLAYAHIDSGKISGVNTNREYEEFIMGGAGAPPYSCDPRADWCDNKYGFATVYILGSFVIVQVYDIDGKPLHAPWVFSKN